MTSVFSKKWFSKHNNLLCKIANSFLGKYIFNFNEYEQPKNIVKITPNSISELSYINNEHVIKQRFFIKNDNAINLYKMFYPVWIIFHTWDMLIANTFCRKLNLGFDTLIEYPALGANSPVDGFCYRRVISGETFAYIRSGNGTYGSPTTELNMRIQANGTSTDRYNELTRYFCLFDTSDIGETDTILSAKISVYGWNKYNGLGTPSLHVCESDLASNSNVIASDYEDNLNYTTSFGSISYSSFSTSGFNDITLNEDGISNISKTGISKFGIKLNFDINNTEPTWVASGESRMLFHSADYDSGNNKPYLTVIYSAPSTFIPKTIIF